MFRKRFKALYCNLLSCFPIVLGANTLPYNAVKAPETQEELLSIQSALIENYKKVRAATVSISVGEGFGSGVLISEEGLILTAAHVTAGVDKVLTVILNDGTELEAVSLGLLSDTDAAMMKITEEGVFPYVEINRDNDYRLADWVFALGHSGGFDKERGPVLRLGRIVKDSDTTLQSDCKVIGGDSGGPLFDLNGKLIGIHSRVSKTVEQNMHVPIREYLNHWEVLNAGEFVGDGPFAKRPVKGSGFLGFASTDSSEGLLITKLLTDGPADAAGVLVQDIVVALNDTAITDRESLKSTMAELAYDEKVTLTVLRDKEKLEIEFRLGQR